MPVKMCSKTGDFDNPKVPNRDFSTKPGLVPGFDIVSDLLQDINPCSKSVPD